MTGIVYYTDGSARPNPGNAGWGLHGYTYELEKPKKGAGLKTHIVTSKGYREKLDQGAKHLEVTPTSYFDILGAIKPPSTNNVAELRSTIEALKHSLTQNTTATPVSEVQILSDSKMVVDGTNSWMDAWRRNGWKKRDGSSLSALSQWQEIYQLKESLKTNKISLAIDWVKGHNDNPGNEKADKLSVIGTMRSKRGNFLTEQDLAPAEGYWTKTATKPAMLDFNGLFFNTLENYNEEGLYYLSNKFRVDDQIGAPTADTAYSIVKLKNPEWIVEWLRKEQIKVCDKGTRDLLVAARLDLLYNNEIYRDIEEYGEDVLDRNSTRWDLYHIKNNDPLTRILMPAKLAMRAIEELTFLSMRLEQFEAKEDALIYNDITSLFYDTIEVKKKGKIENHIKLKDTLPNGVSNIKAVVKAKREETLKEYSIILIFGVDLPSRNALKALETRHPKLTLISWVESDLTLRYATILESDDGISITSSVYSDMKLIQ